jgi:polar amino acid transport system substrate-binding protein
MSIVILSIIIPLSACTSQVDEDSISIENTEIEMNENESTENNMSDQEQGIESDGPITISLIDDTPPYVFKEDGEYKGLIVDIIKESFSRMEIDYAMEAIPFNRTMIQLKEGTLDVGTDIFIKPEREEFLYYPVDYPLAVYPYTLFKLKSTEFDFSGNPEELIPYKLGYVRGYSLGEYDKYVVDERFRFSESKSPEANMNLLINGRVDFVIDVKSTGESVIEKLGLEDEIEAVLPPINSNASYIAFSKVRKLEKLMNEYEAAIESMLSDGTLQEIYDKYELAMPIEMKAE